MEIYWIRHSKTLAPEGLCYGFLDVDLQEGFEEDIKRIKDKTGEIDGIFSSPLKRCRSISEHLANNLPVQYDSNLKELNFGAWEGQEWNSIDKQVLSNWMADFVTVKCPEGENYQELCERVVLFWNGLTKSNYKKVAIVTHGGVIRSILSHILSIPLEKSFKLRIDLGSISLTEVKGDHTSIHYINYR